MKITILGGEKEIGGNKTLVEHKGTRIMLDFGMSFGQAEKYFSEFLQPRKCSALTDFFELGLLPEIPGIYREDYLRHMGRPTEKRTVNAVFLSHAHADHAQYIHFLRLDIPIFSTEATKIILQCLEETGSNRLSDLITACEAFTYYDNKKGEKSRVTRKQKDYVHNREFHIMVPDKKVKIGSLEVEMVPVDHSLPGACGYIIYSDEGTLVYTGDIRFHGSNQKFSRKFVEKAKSIKPKWLLCEGTRIDDEKQDSEEGVMKEISSILSKTKGVVFVEHPIRDLDRVNSIFQSAKANKREFVVNLKLAFLIDKLGDLCPFSLDDVKILIPKKDWGLICKDGIDCKLVEQDYVIWERPFVGMKNAINAEEISKNPWKYVVSMSLWEINQLTDIQPKNAVWIKSICEPFCDDMELDEERKKNWLEHFKIQYEFAHASGHASGGEIKGMIKEINPGELIPIHTEHPELFKK
ncbi:MAG: hypothetical protein A2046_03990 [Bacteroidetes bacterium GWA2_30_7]|nr:MAG: hypothetical protein A2046_03990 [Bacteroidetes bacterium GWA2_30_7]